MTFRLEGGRPTDARGFLHKKILGTISKVAGILPVPGATFVSGITGRLAGATQQKRVATQVKFGNGAVSSRAAVSSITGARPSGTCPSGFRLGPTGPCLTSGDVGRPLGPAQRAPCDFPMVRDPAGNCRTPTSGRLGGEQFGVGEAVMGRYGAALQPGSMIIDRAVCLPGMQLGNDGLCYNKGAITNSQRQWPRGRRPLLTGGDMRAIGIAARAGAKLDRTTKRLRTLGMMKALPKSRGVRAHAHAKPVAAVSVRE